MSLRTHISIKCYGRSSVSIHWQPTLLVTFYRQPPLHYFLGLDGQAHTSLLKLAALQQNGQGFSHGHTHTFLFTAPLAGASAFAFPNGTT